MLIIAILFVIVIVAAIVYWATGGGRSGGSGGGGGVSAPTARITASPRFVCSGHTDAVTLDWSATGDATTVSANPPVSAALGAVSNTDTRRVTIPAAGTTRFSIESTRSGQPTGTAFVDVISFQPGPITIGGQTQCQLWQGLGDSWIWQETRSASDWDSNIRVTRVSFPISTTEFFNVYYNNRLILDETGGGTGDLGGEPISGH